MFFFPLFDDNPSGTKPYVCYGIIALCIFFFFWQSSLPPDLLNQAVNNFGVVPVELLGDQETAETVLRRVLQYIQFISKEFERIEDAHDRIENLLSRKRRGARRHKQRVDLDFIHPDQIWSMSRAQSERGSLPTSIPLMHSYSLYLP